jgi:ribosome recycling factor
LKRGQERLQKLTDQFVTQVDEITRNKEREILEP